MRLYIEVPGWSFEIASKAKPALTLTSRPSAQLSNSPKPCSRSLRTKIRKLVFPTTRRASNPGYEVIGCPYYERAELPSLRDPSELEGSPVIPELDSTKVVPKMGESPSQFSTTSATSSSSRHTNLWSDPSFYANYIQNDYPSSILPGTRDLQSAEISSGSTFGPQPVKVDRTLQRILESQSAMLSQPSPWSRSNRLSPIGMPDNSFQLHTKRRELINLLARNEHVIGYPGLALVSRIQDVTDNSEDEEVGGVERGKSISAKSFVSSVYDIGTNRVNAGLSWEISTPSTGEGPTIQELTIGCSHDAIGAAQDQIQRSISLPSMEKFSEKDVDLVSALIQRSISTPYAPVLADNPSMNTVLQHNQVSLFYASKGGPIIWDSDGGGNFQRTNSWNLRRGLTVIVRSTTCHATSNDPGTPTRSLTVTIKPPLCANAPFAGLMRSTSLENASFLESVSQLQEMRYALRRNEQQPHYFRGGKMSVLSRAPLMEAAYPPVKCEHCERVFTGQNRRRSLAGHRRRAHGYGSRTKARRGGSRRSKRCEGRNSIKVCKKSSSVHSTQVN